MSGVELSEADRALLKRERIKTFLNIYHDERVGLGTDELSRLLAAAREEGREEVRGQDHVSCRESVREWQQRCQEAEQQLETLQEVQALRPSAALSGEGNGASRDQSQSAGVALESKVIDLSALPDDMALAHIYSQAIWHAEALIVANPIGLRAIADACLVAIGSGRSSASLFAADGEGYRLVVERTNSTGLNYARLPYVEELARQDEPDYAAVLRARIAELEAALSSATQVAVTDPGMPSNPSHPTLQEAQTDDGQ